MRMSAHMACQRNGVQALCGRYGRRATREMTRERCQWDSKRYRPGLPHSRRPWRSRELPPAVGNRILLWAYLTQFSSCAARFTPRACLIRAWAAAFCFSRAVFFAFAFACLLESSTTSDFADTFGLFPDFPIPTTATGISQGGSMRWLDPGFVGLVLATPEL